MKEKHQAIIAFSVSKADKGADILNHFDLSSIDKEKPIHFIGIGGVSMSALALILKHHGYRVTGSDFRDGSQLDRVRAAGIPVAIGHSADNIGDAALVVYTAAIHEDNPELKAARASNAVVVERPILLGAMMKRYRCPIAVAGTHGKTTTTSMISQLLMRAQLDPTVLVGGDLPAIGGNLREGGNQYMVMEACEYCGSFLNFFPTVAILLNVEEDHLDFFKDIDDIIGYFKRFAALVPSDGLIVANADEKNVQRCLSNAACKVVTYGLHTANADFTARNISYDELGMGRFDLYKRGKFIRRMELNVPGAHNISNALATIAVGDWLGISSSVLQAGLSDFHGTDRRFQHKGDFNGARIIDDYAHHPTEIAATLAAAGAGTGDVWCVFQPHTYTRALKLKDSFAGCFSGCKQVVVADIYAAREKDTGLIHSRDLAAAIDAASHNAVYIEGFSAIADYLAAHVQPGDTVITLGAGDVYKVGHLLLERNSSK